MPRDSYRDDLEALREAVFALGQQVAERVRTALTAFDAGDVAEAAEVVESDHEINDRYRELESDCIELFALQQPVAEDLRLVAASYKILTDIERVGDLAAKLGKYTREARAHSVPAEVNLYQLGVQAVEQFEQALAAYRDGTVEDCYAVAGADDDLDELCDRTSRLVVRDMIYEDVGAEPAPERVETLLDETSRLLLAVRDLERVGDHAVNIAARTLYMVEADGSLVY
jgi:phosphate transport system protein